MSFNAVNKECLKYRRTIIVLLSFSCLCPLSSIFFYPSSLFLLTVFLMVLYLIFFIQFFLVLLYVQEVLYIVIMGKTSYTCCIYTFKYCLDWSTSLWATPGTRCPRTTRRWARSWTATSTWSTCEPWPRGRPAPATRPPWSCIGRASTPATNRWRSPVRPRAAR